MSFQDWIFSFHLLFAATLVGGLVMSWIVVVALSSTDAADETLGFNEARPRVCAKLSLQMAAFGCHP